MKQRKATSRVRTPRSPCPIANTLDILGDKWTLLVVRDLLFLDKHLYGEFMQSGEGIPTNVLADRLKRLEETGLVVEAGEVLEVLDRIVPGTDGRPQYHYVLVDFLCRRISGEARAGADAAEIAWATEQELGKYGLEAIAVEVIGKGLKKIG